MRLLDRIASNRRRTLEMTDIPTMAAMAVAETIGGADLNKAALPANWRCREKRRGGQ
jgi:hypothetical protein